MSGRAERRSRKARRIPVLRLALTATLLMVSLYGICWVAAVLFNLPAAHALLDLLAWPEIGSVDVLVVAVVGGGFVGALFALLYNLTAFVDDGPGSISGQS